MKMKNGLLMLATIVLVTPVGCSTLTKKSSSETKPASFFDRMPWVGKNKHEQAEEAYPNPVKLAATWTPDTLVQTGRTPTRGFGGRIFFYDEKSRAVPVEGSLIVHGFNDSAERPEDRVKRFEFTSEQFTRHFSQSDLGASYSVWIPWDAIGGKQQRISMVASFKTEAGKLVQGIPATILLPGSTKVSKEDEMARLSPQYRKYRAAADAPSTRNSGLTTTTIPRRGRTPVLNDSHKPGIVIPSIDVPGSMVATGNQTPSADLEMLKRRPAQAASKVLPASAQLPVQR